jgi:hypothetical protein
MHKSSSIQSVFAEWGICPELGGEPGDCLKKEKTMN